jgi:hypothetical protein
VAKVSNRRDRKPKLIERLEEIPASFPSEEAEARWWEEHELTTELLESLPQPDEEELRKRFG